MRPIRCLAVAAACGGLAPAQTETPRPAPFTWETDFDAALAKSRQTGRPVVAYFTFDT